MAAVNYRGCFHDSRIVDWGKIYENLGAVFEGNGGKNAVDSAFVKNRHNFLVKSSQVAPVDVYEAQLNREATSMRQASEWGMRALQSSFLRLKDNAYNQ